MVDRKKLIDQILPTVKYDCYYRLVELEDAEFILSLRNDEKLSKYLSKTSSELEDQINWLKEYKKREAQGLDFYIISMSSDNKIRYGLNRIYDITSDSFEFGSWLYGPDAPKDKAILGDLFTHAIAFESLEFKICTMSTQKNNKRVLRYTKSFNPTLVGEDDLSYYYIYDYETWNIRRNQLLRFLGYSK